MLDKKIILTNKYCEEKINNLSKQIGVSPLLIDILLKRGISDIEAIKTFLYGDMLMHAQKQRLEATQEINKTQNSEKTDKPTLA